MDAAASGGYHPRMAFPGKQLSGILSDCREQGTPFILSIGGQLHAFALPPDHDIILCAPPVELTPDLLRALLAGWHP